MRDHSSETYRPWDLDEKVGPQPWKRDDPKVVAWERAHGHGVGGKCFAELGCQLVVPALQTEISTLCRLGEELREAVETWKPIVSGGPGHGSVRLAKAMAAWDDHMETRFMRAIEEIQ